MATSTLYRANTNITAGTLMISQSDSTASVTITGVIFGLNSSYTYGFHIHEYGVTEFSPNCTVAGGHFNPYNVSHGPREGNLTTRHVGDLGNLITNASGAVYVDITDSIIDLYNATRSVLNLSLVVHATFDDGGNAGVNMSNTTGNAGGRLLCGLIKLVSDTTTMSTSASTAASTTTMSTSTSTAAGTTTMSTSASTTTAAASTATSKLSMAIVNNPSTQWILLIMAIVSYAFSR